MLQKWLTTTNYEKGVTFPTENRLAQLLEALEITPEELLGKDNIQLESEKQLLKLLQEKAQFQAEYRLHLENIKDDLKIRNMLLNKIQSLSNEELFMAIVHLYNLEIQVSTSNYTEELTDIQKDFLR